MNGRPNLLAPGRPLARLTRQDIGLLVVAYAVAWLARWAIAGSQPYTAEAAHYIIARQLWHATPNLVNIYNGLSLDESYLFWQRPVFSLLLAPGAWVSFTAYRALHVTLSSLLPVLASLLLLRLGTRRWLSWPIAFVLAIHPLLVPWGTLALPDSLMAVLTLAGLLAAAHGRPIAMGVFLLAACWTKEVAVVTSAALLAMALARDPDGARASLWPLRLGRFQTVLVAVLALAFVPLLVSLSKPGAYFPGWGVGGDGGVMVEKLSLVVWMAPFPFLALAFQATRRLAVLSLAWWAFFLGYHFVLGRSVEAWYVVLPATLCIMASAAGLSEAWAAWRHRRARWSIPVAALGLAALLCLQVAAADTNQAKVRLITPFSGTGQWSLAQEQAYEAGRESNLHAALGALHPDDRVLAVDVDWSFLLYPVAGATKALYHQDGALTVLWHFDVRPVADAIANRTDAVLVHKADNRFNQAVRSVYADCVAFDNPEYLVLRDCPGRATALDRAVFGPPAGA